MSVESLGGKELDWYFRNINEGVEDISPSARLFVTQIGLEPVLLRAAERLGARVEHASEAISAGAGRTRGSPSSSARETEGPSEPCEPGT